MPVRNVIRVPAPDSFFHVYNRGHNKGLLFTDTQDYDFFIFLLQRCFGPIQLKTAKGRTYPWFGDEVRIQAFCLMPNHFHLLLYQHSNPSALSRSMQSLATTYSMYFNKRHKKRGSVFESVFKATPIMNDAYLQHITRYIHLNPKHYRQWQYSSYRTYLGDSGYAWVDCSRVLNLFDSQTQYRDFIDDYLGLRDELEKLKYDLADHGENL
ncbi:MAG TPA: transposase [Nevskiaceae bacterium]|nr:transposase [Nevskiaceae bacterium]